MARSLSTGHVSILFTSVLQGISMAVGVYLKLDKYLVNKCIGLLLYVSIFSLTEITGPEEQVITGSDFPSSAINLQINTPFLPTNIQL